LSAAKAKWPRWTADIFGGYVKPANLKENRLDRRFARNQNGKRKVVVIVTERGGNSVPAVFGTESAAASFIKARIAEGTTVHADEAGSWDGLHDRFEMKRINHQEAYSLDGACTNQAEEYFSRLRRAEIGIHHHIAGAYLLRYAQESSWREDNRRVSNGDQVSRVAALAMKRGKSVASPAIGSGIKPALFKLALVEIFSALRTSRREAFWTTRPSITKTERPRSANLLQMPRGLMCKLRQRGRDYGGPAGSRGIDPSLQPLPLRSNCWGRPLWRGGIPATRPPHSG
jgi:ISXO2-like transposase domain